MIPLTAFILAYAGLACLALSLPRHARESGFSGSYLHRHAPLRRTGWLLIALAVSPLLTASRPAIMLINLIGLAGAAGAIVLFTLLLRPRLLPHAALFALVLGLLAGLFSF